MRCICVHQPGLMFTSCASRLHPCLCPSHRSPELRQPCFSSPRFVLLTGIELHGPLFAGTQLVLSGAGRGLALLRRTFVCGPWVRRATCSPVRRLIFCARLTCCATLFAFSLSLSTYHTSRSQALRARYPSLGSSTTRQCRS